MKKYLAILMILFSTCSSNTVFNINVDLLSFLEVEELNQSIIFLPSLDVDIYLFPEIEIDLTDSGPGAGVQQGIIINVPSQEINDINSLSLELEIGIEISNNSTSDQINGDRISLYFAPESVENIYTDGIRFDLINVGLLLPQESTSYIQTYALEENGPLLEILRTGSMRLGLGIFLTASSSFLPAEYQLNKISLSSSFTPVEIILLGSQ